MFVWQCLRAPLNVIKNINMKRIKRFGIYQTAKSISIIYFLLIAVVMIPFALISLTFGSGQFSDLPFGSFFFILLPFLYGIVVFIMVAIGCAVYNLVSQWTGGIELEIETVGENAASKVIAPEGSISSEDSL